MKSIVFFIDECGDPPNATSVLKSQVELVRVSLPEKMPFINQLLL
jgi:hypothetical protein